MSANDYNLGGEISNSLIVEDMQQIGDNEESEEFNSLEIDKIRSVSSRMPRFGQSQRASVYIGQTNRASLQE